MEEIITHNVDDVPCTSRFSRRKIRYVLTDNSTRNFLNAQNQTDTYRCTPISSFKILYVLHSLSHENYHKDDDDDDGRFTEKLFPLLKLPTCTILYAY